MEREKQEQRSRFQANTGQVRQPLHRGLGGKILKKVDVGRAPFGNQFAQHILDVRCLYFRVIGRVNGGNQVGKGGIAHGFPGGEAFAHGAVSRYFVGVGGAV